MIEYGSQPSEARAERVCEKREITERARVKSPEKTSKKLKKGIDKVGMM